MKIAASVKRRKNNYPPFIRLLIYSYLKEQELIDKIEKTSKKEKMMI